MWAGILTAQQGGTTSVRRSVRTRHRSLPRPSPRLPRRRRQRRGPYDAFLVVAVVVVVERAGHLYELPCEKASVVEALRRTSRIGCSRSRHRRCRRRRRRSRHRHQHHHWRRHDDLKPGHYAHLPEPERACKTDCSGFDGDFGERGGGVTD